MTDDQDQTPSESEPTAADVAEPATPADVVATPTPKAYTTDVVNVGAGARTRDDDDDDDEDFDEEPADARRLSPHAVAAFAVSLLALFQAPQNVFTAQGLQMPQFLRFVLPTFSVPIIAAVAGIYLAMRGEREIFEADGKLGGLGYVRAARLISIGVLAIALLAIVLVAFFTEQPQGIPQQF